MDCEHPILTWDLSTHATSVGFQRPTGPQRAAAASMTITARSTHKSSRAADADSTVFPSSFPAPLILPDDELSNDPRYPPQSMRSWTHSKDRNKVTQGKRVIYVARPPDIGSDAEFIKTWCHPKKGETSRNFDTPVIDEVVQYLAAFYHGMPVKQLPEKLCFTRWEEESTTPKRSASKARTSSKLKIPSHIGLATQTECIGIRSRPSPDHVFSAQINLEDLLDAAMSILPADAYALVVLVNHDLYEDDDDEFVCGRAYGGSRVAVISTARYDPRLDDIQGVERTHAWPASHCESYIKTCIEAASSSKRSKKKPKFESISVDAISTGDENIDSPMAAALSAYKTTPPLDDQSASDILAGTWLARVCRTSSHELGHCFGIDHCVYYACIMQGSANIIEDVRQPPYLCPVDLAKLLHASETIAETRYRALLAFCGRYPRIQLFMAFGAWIRARIRDGQ